MRVTIEFGGYNPRRYGRPWIARVTAWPIGKPPVLEFGGTVGPYLTEIDATPGAIVRYGQRDNRGGRNTESKWGVVRADGTVDREHDAESCREHWLAGCPVPTAAPADEAGNVVPLRGAQ